MKTDGLFFSKVNCVVGRNVSRETFKLQILHEKYKEG